MLVSDSQRKILLIGPSGTGKSALCNAILSGNVDNASLQKPAKVASSAAGCTDHMQFYFADNTLMVTDTIGFDDNRFEPKFLADELRKVVRMADMGFAKIILCLRLGRVSKDSRVYLRLLSMIFENPESIMILYVSGCEDGSTVENFVEKNKKDEDIGPLLKKLKEYQPNSEYSNIITGTMMVHRNDQIDKDGLLELRKETLKKIMQCISCYTGIIKARPPAELIPRLVEYLNWLFNSYWKSTKENMKGLVDKMWSRHIPIKYHYGECAICLDDDTSKPWTIISCLHKFHTECICALPDTRCPHCRRSFQLEDMEALPLDVS